MSQYRTIESQMIQKLRNSYKQKQEEHTGEHV